MVAKIPNSQDFQYKTPKIFNIKLPKFSIIHSKKIQFQVDFDVKR
ncbi:hypothetical protein HMPREF0673_01909 [Leyella stercorea DSM 18206]|uniref:Uncharacterized protein n=1 Tax=Leyella stercorea DSM 18206 TaxID=1002367 RepID=G6AZ45_9BACT|nr:hypothetical protein HMPREF0673_01909 [Leyella stercorea DSM 18206]